MNKWILILAIYNPNYHGDAAALAMQEFDDVAACQWAADKAQELKSRDYISAVCVPKQITKEGRSNG